MIVPFRNEDSDGLAPVAVVPSTIEDGVLDLVPVIPDDVEVAPLATVSEDVVVFVVTAPDVTVVPDPEDDELPDPV